MKVSRDRPRPPDGQVQMTGRQTGGQVRTERRQVIALISHQVAIRVRGRAAG